MIKLNINKAIYLLLNKSLKSLKFLSESIAKGPLNISNGIYKNFVYRFYINDLKFIMSAIIGYILYIVKIELSQYVLNKNKWKQ